MVIHVDGWEWSQERVRRKAADAVRRGSSFEELSCSGERRGEDRSRRGRCRYLLAESNAEQTYLRFFLAARFCSMISDSGFIGLFFLKN